MKYLKYFLFTSIFVGCDKDNPVMTNDIDSQKYLGLPNTTREYESTEWLYETNSTTPFVKVPDSLFGKLSFDSSSIKNGMTLVNKYSQVVLPKDTSYNKLQFYYPNTVYCQKKTVTLDYKNLETELELALKGIPYTGSTGSSTDGTTYIENSEEYCAQFDDRKKYYILKKPLSVGSEWVRDQWQYKADNGNLETIKIICKVSGKENVVVKAGNFSAYKVEVNTWWVDVNYKSISSYEYYVPNVGLILQEHDMNLYRTIISTNGASSTVSFRQKSRVELVSVNFVGK